MQLWCDERERNGPLPHMVNTPFVVRTTLIVGDFIITDGNNIHVIFERKTWKDLSASLKDGRYKKQIDKMSGIEARRIFIFEGKSYSPETEVAGIQFYKLEAAVRHLMMLGFGTWKTKNEFETAEFLLDFAKQYERLYPEKFLPVQKEPEEKTEKKIIEKKTQKITEDGIVIDEEVEEIEENLLVKGGKAPNKSSIDQAMTKPTETPAQQIEKIWRVIPSIGDKIIPAVSTSFTLYEFIIGCETKTPEFVKKLSELKYISGRTLGIKAAQKAMALDKPEKILGAFPGVSVKSATTVLQQISLFEFIKLPASAMKEYKKTEKTKLGESTADKITHLLHFRI